MYAVLFDIDGTLIQTGGAGQLAFAEAFAEEFDVQKISADVSFAGRSDRAIALDLLNVHGVEASDDNWQRFHRTYVRLLPGALGKREGAVLPGVKDLIAALQEREQVLIGLLTGNVRDGAHTKLTHYGLHDHFAFGGFGDEATDRNQIAATAVAEAQRHLESANGQRNGVQLSGAMAIGDTVHDVRCAKSVGAFAVAVPTGLTPAEVLAAEQPDLLLDDLSDHAAILDVVDAALRT